MSSSKTVELTTDQFILWDASDKSKETLQKIVELTSGSAKEQIEKLGNEIDKLDFSSGEFYFALILCMSNLVMCGV